MVMRKEVNIVFYFFVDFFQISHLEIVRQFSFCHLLPEGLISFPRLLDELILSALISIFAIMDD
jgi:hypothetical protein